MRGGINEVPEEEKQLGKSREERALGGMDLADSLGIPFLPAQNLHWAGVPTCPPPLSVKFQVVVGCLVFPTEAML